MSHGECGTCAFWDRVIGRQDSQMQDEGLCRRRAPQAVANGKVDATGEDKSGVLGVVATWPRTFAEGDWCGEYIYRQFGREKPSNPP